MDELRSYADRRLELGDIIRAALYLAREAGDGQAEQRARDLVARLAADRFRLAVVGQFSRGKSTLMNALLGGAYLPMGAVPMTSVITTVRYGSRPRAIVRRRASGLGTEVPLSQVAGYVAQASATRSELQVLSVEVEIPAEILRLGFEFIDTPGVGSAIEINTATTRRFLPQADAMVFVTGFDSPLTEAEVEFLADAARHAGQLVVVANKRDLVSAADAAGAAEFIRERLRELELGGQDLFGLSALDALEAVTGGNSERLAGSGVPELHAELREFLTTSKTRLFLGNIAAHAARLVAGQRRDLLLGRLALDGGPDPQQVLAAFDAGMAELDSQRRDVAGAIAGRIESRLPGLLANRDPGWQASLLELLGPRAADALREGAAGGPVRDVLEGARASVERAGRDVAGSWVERRAGEVLEMITGAVSGEIGTLLELARSPGAAGAKIAGLPSEDDRRDLAGWSAEDIPGLAARQPAWTVRVELPRRSRRRAGPGDPEVRDRLAAALSAASATYTGHVRTAFQQAARDWAAELGEQAAQQMRQAADWFRQCLRTVPADADLAALDSLLVRLAAFQAGLRTAGEDDAAAGIVMATPSPDAAAGDCVVCRQMEQTLTRQLYSGQFRLATREDEQERHTLGGGFCPLHTWQYAAVASPLGISAGYAGLAASVADALDRLSGPGSAAADLARDVDALTAGPGTCPVCTALAGRERAAIAELISQVPAVPVAVCLRHLALALSAGANAQTGQALLRGLAARLRRDSEDMRAFALKREAYRSGLVTAEESHAHADALRRLAGLPALTQPWANQDPALPA
jgi:Dynamin family